ncbi:N-acetylmuramoyl-L-alanine amidase [uncultured Tistrella sp.]|uniref:peptidoglycan recognition protein family protein n=1 Tax=Tistrella mobilis TaxID=171437 RepID=UPI002637D814|nr:N-acetylmuramoyl-L-alanine amidase [uncultured Tistrella sp.]
MSAQIADGFPELAGFNLVDRPSPNHDERPDGARPDMVVLHYTGMPTAEVAIDWLADPASRVSAHWVVEEDGRITRMVPEDRRAWHAGVSWWRGRERLNDVSIGIEIVNPGHEWGYRDFPEPQMQAVEALLGGILARHDIAPARVVGHSDIAPVRKYDPGERFDWYRLAAKGLALMPANRPVPGEMGLTLGEGDTGQAVTDIQRALAAIGYRIQVDGIYDLVTRSVVHAFQSRFLGLAGGICGPDTAQMIFAVEQLFARDPRAD